MATEETAESIIATISDNVARIRRLNKILTDGKVTIAGEEFNIPVAVRTKLTSKLATLKTATRDELEKLLV